MKKVLNLLLAVTIVGLAYICYRSIMGPIEFAEERSFREKAIIARLIDIRTAQVEYRNITKAGYSDNLDSLIEFVKTAQMPIVLKEGELDDAQLERGLTEKKAMEIIAKAQKTNNWKEVEKEGLKNFRRDFLMDAKMLGYEHYASGRGSNLMWLEHAPRYMGNYQSGNYCASDMMWITKPTSAGGTVERVFGVINPSNFY